MPRIIPTELPHKIELERQQLWLANEKAKNELEPEKWWSKLVRNIVLIGGIFTVFATVFGIWDSV